MNGFFKLKRGFNLCSVNVDAMYPVIKTSTPKPIKPINTPTDCTVMEHVYSTAGVYLKSFCVDLYWRSYEESRINCLKRGMQLYKLDSEEAISTVLDAANKNWYEKGLLHDLHVAADATGYLFISDKEPWGPFKVAPGNSSAGKQSVCEYIDFAAPLITSEATSTSKIYDF
jgi:hypothetical protein